MKADSISNIDASEILPESDSGSACFEESPPMNLENVDDFQVLVQSGSSEPEPASSHRSQPRRKPLAGKLTFLGRDVCRSAHQRLMGIGESIITKIRKGEQVFTQKKRPAEPKHPVTGISMHARETNKWQRVLCFLWLLYHSQAEVLPTKFKMPNGYLMEGGEGDDDDDFQNRYVHSFLQGLHSYHKMPDFNSIGPGCFEGPRRFLQHRKPIDVYNEYVASETAASQIPCALSTFMKVFRCISKDHLKFRSKGEHAECTICSKLKKAMSKARAADDRQKSYRSYSSHILSQWIDRQTYWHQRTLSQAWFRF